MDFNPDAYSSLNVQELNQLCQQLKDEINILNLEINDFFGLKDQKNKPKRIMSEMNNFQSNQIQNSNQNSNQISSLSQPVLNERKRINFSLKNICTSLFQK
ncbi:hypothetical protein M0811_01930 [Anaeramoeba ignava]|uniref:Uncharacterized protein n=1 Tax=Anaeramoeba ignava TaxID=1746090 RepID=A0A9Q0R9Q6_ANAIG|nr:hypothetical protein M0811_01930 [Anaeramoeba ignava]